jgi:hypothetical protein
MKMKLSADLLKSKSVESSGEQNWKDDVANTAKQLNKDVSNVV